MFRAGKNISKAISMLVSANKKISSKIRILPNLLLIKNPTITMTYILRAKQSIFCISISIGQIEKYHLTANVIVKALTLLSK